MAQIKRGRGGRGRLACTLRDRHVAAFVACPVALAPRAPLMIDPALSLPPPPARPLRTPRANWPFDSYSFCQRASTFLFSPRSCSLLSTSMDTS